MHFATRVRTLCIAHLYDVLYSEIALPQKPFRIGHVCIHFFAQNDQYCELPEYWPFPPGTLCIQYMIVYDFV
jgi:hypothetical protein